MNNHVTTWGEPDTALVTDCAGAEDQIARPPIQHAHAQALLSACWSYGWGIEDACDWITLLASIGGLHPQ